MQAFTVHRGRTMPLLRRDIDTDQIIPKQFLKSIDRDGIRPASVPRLARTRRRDASTRTFVLNDPRYAGASILLAGANFGCGSSREHAAWALTDYGFRAVIAPSFADIFRGNAVTNGLLPVVLPEAFVRALAERAHETGGAPIHIDLERQLVTDGQRLSEPFEVDRASRHRLLNGLDDIGLILQHEAAIARYESVVGDQWSVKGGR